MVQWKLGMQRGWQSYGRAGLTIGALLSSACSFIVEPVVQDEGGASDAGVGDGGVGPMCALGPFARDSATILDIDLGPVAIEDLAQPSLTRDGLTLYFEHRLFDGSRDVWRVDALGTEGTQQAVISFIPNDRAYGAVVTPGGTELGYSEWNDSDNGFEPKRANLISADYNLPVDDRIAAYVRSTSVLPSFGGYLAQAGPDTWVYQDLQSADIYQVECGVSDCQPTGSRLDFGFQPVVIEDGTLLLYQQQGGIFMQRREPGGEFDRSPIQLWAYDPWLGDYNQDFYDDSSAWLSPNHCVLIFADRPHGLDMPMRLMKAEKPVP